MRSKAIAAMSDELAAYKPTVGDGFVAAEAKRPVTWDGKPLYCLRTARRLVDIAVEVYYDPARDIVSPEDIELLRSTLLRADGMAERLAEQERRLAAQERQMVALRAAVQGNLPSFFADYPALQTDYSSLPQVLIT